MSLPPLPEPYWELSRAYTAEQMREYARAAVAAEREACAKEADYYAFHSGVARNILMAIRARGAA